MLNLIKSCNPEIHFKIFFIIHTYSVRICRSVFPVVLPSVAHFIFDFSVTTFPLLSCTCLLFLFSVSHFICHLFPKSYIKQNSRFNYTLTFSNTTCLIIQCSRLHFLTLQQKYKMNTYNSHYCSSLNVRIYFDKFNKNIS